MALSAAFVAGGALTLYNGNPIGWAGILFFGATLIQSYFQLRDGSVARPSTYLDDWATEVTLRPNRLRYAVLMIVSACFAVSCGVMVREGLSTGWTGMAAWAGILSFGAGAIVFCLLLVPGSAYLRLDDTGFTVCSLFRVHTIRWCEVDSFEVGTIARRKSVVFNFSNLYPRQKLLRKLSSAISSHEGALPETYGLSAEELSAMLNDWRQHAGPIATSVDQPTPIRT
jgi:hypothetical protein